MTEITTKVVRHRTLSPFWLYIIATLSTAGISLAILQIFVIRPLIENGYLYWLLALFLSIVFIVFPATKKASRDRVPLYDVVSFLLTFGISIYLALNAWDITHSGAAFQAPLYLSIPSLIFCLLTLEAVRRAGGMGLFIFSSFFALFPLFSSIMPGPLQGNSYPLWPMVSYHVLSTESVIGIPMTVVGNIVIGFMIFGVVMVATGGGKFFLDFATALFGSHRGGPAKVAVISSGFFGSLSGSVISNVVTTGSVTIPAMKKTGYPSYYAGAVEACSSTGGCIMPPVMGAVAFVMASFLETSYWSIVIAAFLPAVLYYSGLFWQVDAYAGRVGLKGLDASETPHLRSVLAEGWPYIFVFVLLIFILYLRREGQAPFYASAALLVIAMMRKQTRLNLKDFIRLMGDTGKLLAEIVAILAACGFIIGAFSITGIGHSFSRELVLMAHGNPLGMLILGAAASYILGMGMTVTACYIFLAIVLAPGLTAVGFSPVATHLFVLYWGMVSFITPPVALGSYVASGLAGSSPMKTGLTAMRLGLVLYFVPFLFIYNPALVMQGSPFEVLSIFTTTAIGIALIASSFERYLIGIGSLSVRFSLLFFCAGFLLAMPGLLTDAIGIGVAGGAALYLKVKEKKVHQQGGTSESH